MNDELLKPRVLRELRLAGRPLGCYEITAALYGLSDNHLSEVRGALEVLIKDGDVVAVGRFMSGRMVGMGRDREKQHEN